MMKKGVENNEILWQRTVSWQRVDEISGTSRADAVYQDYEASSEYSGAAAE